MLNTIIDCTDKLLDRWRTYHTDPTKVHLNMIDQSQQLLLAIFGFIAFDYDLQTLDDNSENNPNELTQAFYSLLNSMQTIFRLPTFLARIFIFLNFKARRARVIIDRYLESMIEHELNATSEMREKRKRISLIASLVTSLQEDENAEASKPEEEKKGLSRVEVMNEMLAFLAAGYGTTSTAVSWFIYYMSKNPEVQKKMKQELAELNGQRFSLEQLDSFIYLDCVLREVLRLVSPALGTVRTLTTDDQLKKEIFISALMAFGGGHRQCMGQDLARFELKIICARLMQFVTFGDGGPELNAGGHDVTDTNKPRKIGVTITFD